MSRCLPDRTLWLMSEGEASRGDRVHVTSCAVCAARLRRLEQDLRRLRLVLTGPPPQLVPARLRPVRVRWLTAAATLVAMLIVVSVGLWWQQPSSPTLPTAAHQESVWPFIELISAAIFPDIDGGLAGTPDQLPDLADLHAALDGDWPCEGQATLASVACNDDTFALLLGGPSTQERYR
jgi:hypothetical protein